jgi:antitoxin component YwqK of YwqJK toxin-antitoxin module
MKKYLLSFLILIISSSFVNISFSQIISAIKTGKSDEVAKYFDSTVEITLPAKSNSYSKRQAELVLHDFFKNNPVKSFEVIHQSENGNSQYCIGNLSTDNGVFRTTIFIKQKGQKQLVQELRFEN